MFFIRIYIILIFLLPSSGIAVELSTRINNKEVKVLMPVGLKTAELYINGKNCSIEHKTSVKLENTGHLVLTLEESELNMKHKIYFYNFYRTEIGSKNTLFRELYENGELSRTFSPITWHYER